MTEANVLSFAKEAGIRMTFWHVTDGGFDSVDELAKTLARFGSDVSHVVVKNYGRSKDFQQLDESDAKKRLDELGGQVLELAALDPSVMYKIDRLGSSFWAAIHTAEGAFALKPLERERAKLWLQKSYAAFDGCVSGT